MAQLVAKHQVPEWRAYSVRETQQCPTTGFSALGSSAPVPLNWIRWIWGISASRLCCNMISLATRTKTPTYTHAKIACKKASLATKSLTSVKCHTSVPSSVTTPLVFSQKSSFSMENRMHIDSFLSNMPHQCVCGVLASSRPYACASKTVIRCSTFHQRRIAIATDHQETI